MLGCIFNLQDPSYKITVHSGLDTYNVVKLSLQILMLRLLLFH